MPNGENDMKLLEKKCVACKGGQLPYTREEAENMLPQINPAWELLDGSTKLTRVFKFKNFSVPMNLAVRIGEIADNENHHPDLNISWGKLSVTITTHTIKGLAESDFIFAAKVDEAFERFTP